MNNQNVLQLPPLFWSEALGGGNICQTFAVKTSLNIAVVPKRLLIPHAKTHIPKISCNFLLVTHQVAFSHWHKYCSTFLPLPAILQLSHMSSKLKTYALVALLRSRWHKYCSTFLSYSWKSDWGISHTFLQNCFDCDNPMLSWVWYEEEGWRKVYGASLD